MSNQDVPPANGALYRAVWRGHLIAGLIVLPFLAMLALTGGAYLFKTELDHFIYRGMQDVPVRTTAFAPASEIVRQTEAALDGRVLQWVPPVQRDRAAKLMVRVASGEVVTAFADPYDGHLTGSTPYGGFMQVLRKVHSLQMFGFWASCLIEISAGWAIALVGTGLFLWWPRGQRKGGVVSVRGTPKQRVFWRDLHAVTGMFSAAVILFLAATGMPWSMFWGDHVQQWATTANLNEPEPPAHVTPDWLMSATMPNMPHTPHTQDGAAKPEVPWAMEKMEMPMSHPAAAMAPMGIDRAVLLFQRLGVDSTASISLPDGPEGPFVASWRPDRVEDTRIVYLDQYSGKVLGDVGFKDYGPVGKAIEWGIAVHQGQEYGEANRYLMLAGCVAIVLLAFSSITMWWKRRPKGSWGLPPAAAEPRAMAWLLGTLAFIGVLLPMVGATLLVAILVDRIVRAARHSRSRRNPMA